MTTDSTARCCLMLASVLGLALAGVAHAQTQPAATVIDKGAKRTKAVQSDVVTSHGTGQHIVDKNDADQPDMILLQEPFRPSPATPVSVTRSR